MERFRHAETNAFCVEGDMELTPPISAAFCHDLRSPNQPPSKPSLFLFSSITPLSPLPFLTRCGVVGEVGVIGGLTIMGLTPTVGLGYGVVKKKVNHIIEEKSKDDLAES